MEVWDNYVLQKLSYIKIRVEENIYEPSIVYNTWFINIFFHSYFNIR